MDNGESETPTASTKFCQLKPSSRISASIMLAYKQQQGKQTNRSVCLNWNQKLTWWFFNCDFGTCKPLDSFPTAQPIRVPIRVNKSTTSSKTPQQSLECNLQALKQVSYQLPLQKDIKAQGNPPNLRCKVDPPGPQRDALTCLPKE